MGFGRRLKELREAKKLSQEALADILGIPRSSIAHYENSENEDKERIPRKERLEKIAKFFNVSVDYLLGITDDPAPPSQSSLPSLTSEEVHHEIGDRLKQLRQQKGWDLRELENRSGIEYSYLSQIEDNKITPSPEQLEILARLFDVHISYFFGELIETPEELKDLVDWIALSKELKEQGLTPEQVKQIVEFARKIKEI